MKETLRKEIRGENIKRKHDDILIELEKLKETYQILESDKDALVLSTTITEREKMDLEQKVSELENQRATTDKRVEELEMHNSFLDQQLKVENEKQLDISPFRNQASLLQTEINQIQLNLEGEMYRIQQIEARLNEMAHSSSEFRKNLSEVAELVQS